MSYVHLHLMLNHVPVVGTLIGLGLLAYAVLRRDEGLARVCLGLLAVLAVAGAAAFFTGEPAEEAVEGLARISEAAVERHEEAARVATIALGLLGALSLALLVRFRRRPLPRGAALVFLALALLPAAAMAWTASLNGRIRHPEIIGSGAAVPGVSVSHAAAGQPGRADAEDTPPSPGPEAAP